MYRRTRAQLREHSGRRSVEDISINFTAGAFRFFFLPGLPPALEKVSKRNSTMNRRGNRIDNYYDPSRYGRTLSERLALKEANIKVVLVYFGEPSIVSGMNTMEKVLASFSFRLATKETREMLLAFSILQRTRFPLLPFFPPSSSLYPFVQLRNEKASQYQKSSSVSRQRERTVYLAGMEWTRRSDDTKNFERDSLLLASHRTKLAAPMFARLSYNSTSITN